MDPNPNSFPVLSYVMTRLNPNPKPDEPIDIEQPPITDTMPNLSSPSLLSSMATAVAEVAKTRSVLDSLGDRPDHESVDRARSGLLVVDSDLSARLDEIRLAPKPRELDDATWQIEVSAREAAARAAAEREMRRMREVVRLDEMHEEYGRLLRDAEERLVRIYEKHGRDDGGEEEERGAKEEEEEVNEEVVRILREDAAGRYMERVELSGRKLKFLPEAFGRMRGMVFLDLSNNLLEVYRHKYIDHIMDLALGCLIHVFSSQD